MGAGTGKQHDRDPPSFWFADWIDYHRLLHPDNRWIDPNGDQGWDYYQGWIEAFTDRRIVYEEACRASRRLQGRLVRFNEHLAMVLVEVASLRNEVAASVPAPRDAIPRASVDPEFDRAVDAHWARLSEGERERWRSFAKEKVPHLSALPFFLNAHAKVYAFNRSGVRK